MSNTLEQLNKEVKRQANVVGIIPDEACILRLIGAVLIEPNEGNNVIAYFPSPSHYLGQGG